MNTPRFSVIVPVYNRPGEVKELLDSLLVQTVKNFEVILIEDGSTEPCRKEYESAKAAGLDAKYYFKENEGRSIARNYGMERASGDYFVFFDSDCVIPQDYFRRSQSLLMKSLSTVSEARTPHTNHFRTHRRP